MTIKEQSAYLKGMLAGMKLDESRDETKLFSAIIDAIENLSISCSNLDEDVDGILKELEVVDEDLATVENEVYGEQCDCDCDCDCNCGDDCDCEDCDCGCKCCSCDDDDDECYEVVCPTCKKKICISEEILEEEEMNCPNCGELLEFDYSECDCEDCDCDDCDCEENEECDCDYKNQ